MSSENITVALLCPVGLHLLAVASTVGSFETGVTANPREYK